MTESQDRREAKQASRPHNPAPPATPERICPNCGAGLQELRCKLLCPNRACGYFMSCSDFY